MVPASEIVASLRWVRFAEAHMSTVQTTEQAVANILQQLRANQVEAAVSTYQSYREDLGYPLLGRVGQDPGLQKAVANLFYRARDYSKAAVCCENLGEFEKAAMLYERGEDYVMAAEMFTRQGQALRAAEMFEKARQFKSAAEMFHKAGDIQRAATNFERANDFLRAGRLYQQQARFPQALEVLQKLKKTDHDFFDGTLLIAEVLALTGHIELAERKLLPMKPGSDLDDNSARVVYALAQLAALRGGIDEAKSLYNDLLAWNFGYRDVKAKLEALDKAPPKPVVKKTMPAPLPDSEGGEGTAIVSVMEGFEHLKQLPLFEALSLSDLKAFYNACTTVTAEPGHVLINQGVPGEAMWILTHGKMEVRKIVEGAAPVTLVTLGPGAYVGEMGLVDDAPTSAEVRAAEQATLLRISKVDFHKLLGTSDHMALCIYRVFVKTLGERLRTTTAKLNK